MHDGIWVLYSRQWRLFVSCIRCPDEHSGPPSILPNLQEEEGITSGVKRPDIVAAYSASSVAEVKNTCSYSSTYMKSSFCDVY